MAQGDCLPGTHSRVGTEENPGTYLGGDSGVRKVDLKGVYQVYVLDADGSVERETVFECK